MELNEKELEKLKEEINYHKTCGTCVSCGECERILEMVLKERQEAEGKPRPCDKCHL